MPNTYACNWCFQSKCSNISAEGLPLVLFIITVLCIVTCGYVILIALYFALLCTCVPWFYKLHVCEF